MEHRGVEYTLVRTIDKGWRWSVKRGRGDKTGSASDRERAIFRAKRFIDEMLSRASKKSRDLSQ